MLAKIVTKRRKWKSTARLRNRIGVSLEDLESRLLLDATAVLTELMAINNRTLRDQDGDYSDWIEVHNPADVDTNLAGWYLTDDPDRLTKWQFPAVTMEPGGYSVVFASGKDRAHSVSELHTNFKLSGDGEYLALVEPDGVTIAQQFSPSYPPQSADVTYGLSSDLKALNFFDSPTPGAENNSGAMGIVDSVGFNVERGFFDGPFDVQLTTSTPEAEIRFTLDGSAPSTDNGTLYSQPIHVESTTTVRAVAWKEGFLPSQIATHTYLFLQDVLTQTKPDGYPDLRAGDYNVLPSVVNQHQDTLLDDLKAVPSMSLVFNIDDMFGPDGINSTSGSFDKPTSVEWFYPDGREGFQIDAGVRQQGGASRMPGVPKHAFRLKFTAEFGPTKLEFPLFEDSPVTSFDTVTLRANLQDGWQRGSIAGNQQIKDEFARRTQRAMGHLASHGRFVHLYLNGLYWGLYNLVERPDASFTSAHLGGAKEDWDALNAGRIRDGNTDAWEAMLALTPTTGFDARTNFDEARVEANYEAIQHYLDIPAFIDYLLLGSYMGTQDWLPNNYYVGRQSRDGDAAIDPADPNGKFQFFHWDQEQSLLGLDSFKNLPGFLSPVGQILQLLRLSPEFRELNGQRMFDHFYNGGALSPEATSERYHRLAVEVQHALKGEAIRWGAGPDTMAQWQSDVDSLVNDFFPNRREGIVDQYRRFRLYPAIDAPYLNQHGGQVRPTDLVTIQAAEGDIYYTLDGSDPKLSDGSISADAIRYTDPITLQENTVIRFRALAGEDWSARNEASFEVVDQLFVVGDFDNNQNVDIADIDLLCQELRSQDAQLKFDLTGDGNVQQSDLEHLVEDILGTRIGDVNLDGEFDNNDLVELFQTGQFESPESSSTWSTGDWNCDGAFETKDLVLAFQVGGYVSGGGAN